MTPDIDAAKAALAHLELIENPKLVRTYSRDFFLVFANTKGSHG